MRPRFVAPYQLLNRLTTVSNSRQTAIELNRALCVSSSGFLSSSLLRFDTSLCTYSPKPIQCIYPVLAFSLIYHSLPRPAAA